MASSGRPDIGISTIPYAPIRQIRQNSPLPGLFPKLPSTVPCLSNLFQKICLSTGDYRKNTPKRSHPFGTFSKNLCLSTADYQKKYPKRSHPFRKKSEKNCLLTSVYHFFTIEMLQLFRIFPKNFHPLPRLFPKRHPSVLPLSEKNPKKSSLHH